MKGIVPAAGRGTRLGALTDDTPKGLVEIAGRPLLTHVYETLIDSGIDELVTVVGYEGSQIIDYYGDTFSGVPITYAWQHDQLGLGHAVLQAEPYVEGQFVVLNGDNVFGGRIDRAINRATGTDIDATLLVEEVSKETAAETGVVETDNGHVTGVCEKPDDPSSTLVTTGCYVLPASIFHACRLLQPSARGEYELSEAVNLLIAARYSVETVRLDGQRVNVNSPADISDAETLLD